MSEKTVYTFEEPLVVESVSLPSKGNSFVKNLRMFSARNEATDESLYAEFVDVSVEIDQKIEKVEIIPSEYREQNMVVCVEINHTGDNYGYQFVGEPSRMTTYYATASICSKVQLCDIHLGEKYIIKF